MSDTNGETSTARRMREFAGTVVRGISDRNVTFMAGSIAYQAFISLIPLLVLAFFLVSVVGDEGLASQVTQTTQGFLPAAGNELLEGAISGSVATTGGTVIGLVTLLWGSLKIFRGLDTAFSEIYESTGEASFVDQLRDAFVVFFAIGLALLAAAVASVVFAIFPENTLIGVLNPIVLVVGLTLAFVPMYYYFPDVETTVREILPGAVAAAIGWAVLQGLFQVYVSVAAGSESAGPIGAILLLLSWLYFGGLVLLIGAVVNAARSGHLPAADGSAEHGTPVDSRDDDRPQEFDGIHAASGPRPGAERTFERNIARLEREVADLEGQLAMLENDLGAQRSRRYRLEDRAATLEAETERLRSENRDLRRRVERQSRPAWRRTLERLFERATSVNVGVVRRS
ncbi:ribonuclease BN [Halostagnicola larsenii XH-48]|uniref:Ribonuclease BN n=1 Tax=Halostagnicola larsenii XH-48 TaxID=797299 RepID=W0JLN0_9EURY|nr:YhjD/YihY/BrkB family envelope integrity protein [Halostagnicola larsenii]AHF99498.1 ribonuclease BN [Halostagnicola larsenii XH-48]